MAAGKIVKFNRIMVSIDTSVVILSPAPLPDPAAGNYRSAGKHFVMRVAVALYRPYPQRSRCIPPPHT